MSKLTIEQNTQDGTTTFVLGGRLDSITSAELNDRLLDEFDKVDGVVLDMEGLVYLSSAGLRVVLAAQRKANSSKKAYKLIHVSDEMRELFDMVGFTDLLTIE